MSSLVGPDEDDPRGKLPVPSEVQDAVRTLIRWAGDDPEREGLRDTPQRVARACDTERVAGRRDEQSTQASGSRLVGVERDGELPGLGETGQERTEPARRHIRELDLIDGVGDVDAGRRERRQVDG